MDVELVGTYPDRPRVSLHQPLTAVQLALLDRALAELDCPPELAAEVEPVRRFLAGVRETVAATLG